MKQRTIQQQVTLSGVGLHTGSKVKLQFLPALVNHGCKFQRTDLRDKPFIPADVMRVVSTQRGTTLQHEDAEVHTVEHVLSALTGMGLDNVVIAIDGPEIPILDGSALPFVKALQQAGIQEQEEDREYFEILEPITFRDPVTGSEMVAMPSDHFEVTTLIDFNSPVLGQQFATLSDIEQYAGEIAPCRTFVFLHELEYLFSQNLIKGGDLDNAIVIVDRPMSQLELDALAEKLEKPSVQVSGEGILNTIDLHFKNEPARHKLLDVVGDISLLGKPIKGKITAVKPGHRVNVEFTKLLRKHLLDQRKQKSRPKYDPDKEPVLNTVQIESWLPHRHPFCLVDKIIELTDSYVVGVKNVTGTEFFFQGHFPGNPVMPGVLQIEALAQTGGILAMYIVGDPGHWDTYFLKIENTKFKAKVVPGDTLLLKMELMQPIRRGIVQMQGTAYVGSKIVAEGELTAQIVKRSSNE